MTISPEALEKARSLVANYGSDPDGLLVGAIAAALSLPDQPDAARAGVRELDDDQIMEIIKEVAPWRDEPKLNDLLTYEKSPPLFPQATYDVPSYRATKFVRAVERRILSALVPEPSPAQADGLRAAIQWVEKRRDDYVAEHGSYDPETGATEFPGNGDEYVGELEEIIEGLEALRPAPKQFLATEDGEFNGNAPAQADERVVEALREVRRTFETIAECAENCIHSPGQATNRSLAQYGIASIDAALESLVARIAELEARLRGLLDCPDIADNDYKDEETHAAERRARSLLNKDRQP